MGADGGSDRRAGRRPDITADAVADVLFLGYECELSYRAIGRQLEMDLHAVGKIVAASSDLLRTGQVALSDDYVVAPPRRAVS
ncbi:MAG: hypothetical protein JWR37_1137 [Mycobacterium sp.]|nr:hypothetical protein [Mycobacterium sp.]